MIKQYGIDPRLVIWIRRNTGHDLQTFNNLAKIKYLDSRRRNYSAVKKIEDVRLPACLQPAETYRGVETAVLPERDKRRKNRRTQRGRAALMAFSSFDGIGCD